MFSLFDILSRWSKQQLKLEHFEKELDTHIIISAFAVLLISLNVNY